VTFQPLAVHSAIWMQLTRIPVAEPVTRDLVRVQVFDAFAPALLAEPRRVRLKE
jgi:hypothetical protein